MPFNDADQGEEEEEEEETEDQGTYIVLHFHSSLSFLWWQEGAGSQRVGSGHVLVFDTIDWRLDVL